MMKLVFLIAIITLSVFAVDPNDPFKCDANGKCPPGSRCEDGTCYGRPDCPQVMMPRMKPGCEMTLVPDERDCPMPKITCSKENLKCGDTYCERGYVCNKSTQKCVERWDCPPVLKPPKGDKCYEMVLDEFDCFVPVNICEKGNRSSIRPRRSATENSTQCPKNAEFRECTNLCPEKTCDNYLQRSPCFSLRCGPPGCMCKEGHVLLSSNKEQGCVSRETCTKLNSLKKTIERDPIN
ncbi:hypothetical protein KIN20_036436 [Parelaphostrongylus tenuis]|uniref:TIL domain-containing protein n=1 Tax=Parelaphostrongylus tenuis TaxID=148309 RepID=A0AAD5RD15_PARTN|nr:hypothetical protein KIN20_036436 [Parelaphostrongylus tenuis]